jgi:hypothetical protein
MQAVGNDVPDAKVGGSKAPHEGKQQQQPDSLKILDTKQPLASEAVRGESQGKKKKKQAGNKKKGDNRADTDKLHKEKENTDHNNKGKQERKDGAEKATNEGERHHEPEPPKKPAWKKEALPVTKVCIW